MESKSPSEHGQEEERQIRKSIKKADKKLKKEKEGKVRKAPKPVGRTRSGKLPLETQSARSQWAFVNISDDVKKFVQNTQGKSLHGALLPKGDTRKKKRREGNVIWKPTTKNVTLIKRESTDEKVKVGGTRHQSFENYYHPDGKKANQLKTKFERKAKQQKAMAKKNAKSYHQQMKRSSAPKSSAGRAMTGTKRKNAKTRKA